MSYRKNTIRKLAGPQSRKVARLINDLDSSLTKLKNLMPAIESIEIDSIALYRRLSTYEKKSFQDEKENRPTEQMPLEPRLSEICDTCAKSCKGELLDFSGTCTQYEQEIELPQ